MLRSLLAAVLLLSLAAAAPVSAEEVSVGPCQIDACVYACVHVHEACPGNTDACILFAFRYWCV